MKIDIPDSLYQSYIEVLENCPHLGGLDENIQRLIKVELRRIAELGYENDRLTGCKTRNQLGDDLIRAMPVSCRGDRPVFTARYLCFDIDDFCNFLDYHGLLEGDKVLVEIANQLRGKYTDARVYRFGGDGFVVDLGRQEYTPIAVPSEIRIKYSLVEIDAKIGTSKRHHLHSLIMLNIHRGVVESNEQGNRIFLKYEG
jgi:diguanylate cyclase (GGDEF)-like protein